MIEKRKFTIRVTKAEVFEALKAHFPYVVSTQAIPPGAALAAGAGFLDITWEKDVVSVHRTDGGGLPPSPTGGTPAAATAEEEMAEGFADEMTRMVA